MFSSAFVCLFVRSFVSRITQKLIFTKIGGKLAHGPRKKPLDFGSNPGSCYVRVRVTVRWEYCLR